MGNIMLYCTIIVSMIKIALLNRGVNVRQLRQGGKLAGVKIKTLI